MPHPLALALLAGIMSSAMFLSLLTGFPGMVLFAYFVQLPLLLVGFTTGFAGAVLAAGGALLVNGLIAGALAAAIYALVQALPALIVVRQALLSRQSAGQTEWYPPGMILVQLTALAALSVTIAFLAFAGEPGGLQGAIEHFLHEALVAFGALPADAPLPPETTSLAFLFPGVMATSWIVMVVLNAVLAQALACSIGWNRRPSPDFAALELPFWLWPALALAALLSLLGESAFGFFGRSLLTVLVVPYVFLGLAVLHALARRWSHPKLALAAIYASIVLFGWPIVLVLLLGLVEDWAHLRRRLV